MLTLFLLMLASILAGAALELNRVRKIRAHRAIVRRIRWYCEGGER